jgi:hypothetical protein
LGRPPAPCPNSEVLAAAMVPKGFIINHC